MHPIEQLRYLARSGEGDATALAAEAADALASLAFDPRALVPACRRLLEFHPTAAPLWWVCAQVLGAADPAGAARAAESSLLSDETVDELAGCLPAGAVVVGNATPLIAEALSQRPDCSARLVGAHFELRSCLGLLADLDEVLGFSADAASAAVAGTTVAVLEPLGAGPSGAALSKAAAAVATAASASAVPIWLVAGVGRVLPGELYEAMTAGSGAERIDAGRIDVVVGPEGPASGAGALVVAGPAPTELLGGRRAQPDRR